MGRASRGGVLLTLAVLAGCGPDWQPSWNMSSTPAVEGDSLTIARVTGQEPEFTPLQSESMVELRQAVGTLLNSPPRGPDAAMTSVPEYRPVPRPDIDAQTRRPGSSTPPDVLATPSPPPPRPPARAVAPTLPPDAARVEGVPVIVPGQPAGTTTGGTDRVQTFNQPNSAGGGVVVRDGGTTTVIQPGGRVTTIPTPR
ncbi:hypothetical protein [Roseomonas sp. CAU 1739]|uniref:hypothetical protein n=1 Tax=Roseomonas sp. CAU 1739 TaxID=3140364 RepID=UPI00325C312A